MANNANNALNNEKAAAARKKLIKTGGIGAAVSFFAAFALILTGILLTVNKITAAGIVCIVIGALGFIVFAVFLIMLLIGVFMVAGGAGAKVLDTTSVCPACGTQYFVNDKDCPSCGTPRQGK